MTSRVSILDITIDANIDDIIGSDLRKISDVNRAAIDTAIESSRVLNVVRENKIKAADGITTKLNAAYDLLIGTLGTNSRIPSTQLLATVAPDITNLNGLMQRLRQLLKEKRPDLAIAATRSKGVNGYSLEQITSSQDAVPSAS